MKRYWVNHEDSGSDNFPDWRTDVTTDDLEEAKVLARKKQSEGFEVNIIDSATGAWVGFSTGVK